MGSFTKATRTKAKLKIALSGPSGSGKTMGALRLARGMTKGDIVFIDTENRSASLYAGHKLIDDRTGAEYALDFMVADIAPPYTADAFHRIITDAKATGAEVVVIDSFSHVWEAVLEAKEKADRLGGNSYINWGEAGKSFQRVVDLVRHLDMHVIVCMRSKMEYVLEMNSKGKQVPVKVGLAPVVRDGTEYEFSTMFNVGMDHMAHDSKGRLAHITGGEPIKLTEAVGERLRQWVEEGADIPEPDVWNDGKKAEAAALCVTLSALGDHSEFIKALRTSGNPPSITIKALNDAITKEAKQ